MSTRWPWLLAAGLGAVVVMSTRSTRRKPAIDRALRERMIALVRRVARELGVPAAVALAFADVESGFNPAEQGDLKWPEKKPELFRKLVLDKGGPYAGDPSLWHSYGLFQLLAPYHVLVGEHPHVLLDPELNARRGIAAIKRLLKTTGGNAEAARLAYIGCGVDGARCADDVTAAALARFRPALSKWLNAEGIA